MSTIEKSISDTNKTTKTNKKIPNYTAKINTTENGKNYSLDISGLTETERFWGGQDDNSPPSPGTKNVQTNNDVNEILGAIRKHLDKFKTIDNFNLGTFNDNLKIGENTISVLCMLHFMGNNKAFLRNAASQCSATIKKYQSNGSLDLGKLIELSQNFKEDNNFYQNLYSFDLAMVNFIFKDPAFKEASPETQATLVNNVQKFIRETLDYLTKYMTENGIINDKLVVSGYDLLYLLNKLTLLRISTTPDMLSLEKLYQRLKDAVDANITAYKEIKQNEIGKPVSVEKIPMPEVDALKEQLEARIKSLEDQHKSIQSNVKDINNDTKNLENFITDNAKLIVS